MRKEREILKDFEQLGYKEHYWILADNLILHKDNIVLKINTEARMYKSAIIEDNGVHERAVNEEERKLINQIFELWGWL